MTSLRLAERLGAKVATIQGNSIDAAVVEFALKNNITKVVLGKPRRKLWRNLLGISIENQIMRQSKYFDVYIVSDTREKTKTERVSETPVSQLVKLFAGAWLSSAWLPCWVSWDMPYYPHPLWL